MKSNPYVLWKKISPLPFGKTVFSKILGWMIPYTGTIGARIETWEVGHAIIRVWDCRKIRNHLRSIHAVALANIGELSSGLSLHSALPPRRRAILLGLRTKYLKKARGTLTAEAKCPSLSDSLEQDIEIESIIMNASGEAVCQVWAEWRVGPEKT